MLTLTWRAVGGVFMSSRCEMLGMQNLTMFFLQEDQWTVMQPTILPMLEHHHTASVATHNIDFHEMLEKEV